jgi:hypothetical protein
MKRITALAFFTIAGFLTAGHALAQQHEVRATVPFDFTVGGKLLPSGNYTINSVSNGGIEIRSREQHIAVLALAFPTVEQSAKGNELVFEKHAGEYSLREILCESYAMNLSLPAEKWRKGTPRDEAKLHTRNEQVLIAAK